MPKTGSNIYKRKDGRWEGRYPKTRKPDGRIAYGYVYAKTCTEVKRRLSIQPTADATHMATDWQSDNTAVTFAEAARQWLSVASLKVKPSTYAVYAAALELHILPSLGARHMRELSSVKVSRFAVDKLEHGRADGAGGLSVKTVRDMLSVIKAVMDFAREERYISATFPITYPKQQRRAMRVLSRQEQTALESSLMIDMDVYKLGILLCLYTGIRVGELCALRWQDFSPDFGSLTVERTLQRVRDMGEEARRTKILVDAPKSRCAVREIPIPQFLIPCLQKFIVKGYSYFLGSNVSDFVEPRTMQNHFARCVKEANISSANYHSLRHTFATRCIEAGVDVKSLSEMLGHASVNITLNRYVHSSLEQKREGMNKLEQYIGM
jgi:integrase